MLRQALDHARSMELPRVLITCDRSNAASARTILRCGGAMENEITGDDGRIFQRYWIEL
jgi:predicted acetyltransferase